MQHILAPIEGLQVKAEINDIGQHYDKDKGE